LRVKVGSEREEGTDKGDGFQERVANMSSQSRDKKRRKVESAKLEAIAELKVTEDHKIQALQVVQC